MTLALTEWPRMRQVALELGFGVETFVDAGVPRHEFEAAALVANWPQALIDSTLPCQPPAATNHFPRFQTAVYGQPHPWPLVGAMPKQAWQMALVSRMAANHSKSALDTYPARSRQSDAHSRLQGSPISAPTPLSNRGAMAKQTITSTVDLTAKATGSACIAANEYIAITSATAPAELGSYERISPDGRFILRSFSGAQLTQVNLVEIERPPGQVARLKTHSTGLTNEAFPVQGTWRYLVDVNGDHFRFADVLRLGPDAKAQFRAGMTGFYAAASELADAENGVAAGRAVMPFTTLYIRSLSWPNATSDTAPGEGPLQVRTVAVQLQPSGDRVVADTGNQYLCSQRTAKDGNLFALPMISVDGLAFSAIPLAPKTGQPSMRTYRLAPAPMATEHPCTLVHDLRGAPSKLVFGANPQSPLAYTDNARTYAYMPTSGRAFALDNERFNVLSEGFPGVTQDGRIIFAATWQNCAEPGCGKQTGYVVSDPYQIQEWHDWGTQAASRQLPSLAKTKDAPKMCITQAEVLEQERVFAQFHGLQARGVQPSIQTAKNGTITP